MSNNNLSQEVGVVAQLVPVAASARAAGSWYTGPVNVGKDASNFDRLVAIVQIGSLAGAGTVNCRWQHGAAAASDDSTWANVNAAAVTSTFVSGSNDKIGLLELRLDQYPTLNKYVRVLATLAVSTWTGGILVIGTGSKFLPVTHTTEVVETIVY